MSVHNFVGLGVSVKGTCGCQLRNYLRPYNCQGRGFSRMTRRFSGSLLITFESPWPWLLRQKPQIQLERNLCKFAGKDNAHGNQQNVYVDSRFGTELNWTALNWTEPNWTDLRTSPWHRNSYSTDTSSLGTFNKASRIEIRSISINALKICHPHGATHMGYVWFENGWVDFWGVEFMDYNVCFDMLDDSAGGRVEFPTAGACEKHQQNFH